MSDNTLSQIDLSSRNLPNDEMALAMLNKLAAIYNEVVSKVAEFRAKDKGDDQVSQIISSPDAFEDLPTELTENIEKLDKLKAAVSQISELVNAQAAEYLASRESEDGFDPDKARQDIRALRREGGETYKTILSVFEMTGKVSISRTTSGQIEDVEPQDAFGEVLGEMSSFPNVRGTSGSSSQTKNDLSKVREWAKANNFDVADRGRISADILKAYNEANGAEEHNADDEA